jgi:hypothetical protein
MGHGSSKTIKPPHNQGIPWLQHGQTGIKAGPVGSRTRGLVDEEMGLITPRAF